jgi:hypothetical protein
MKKKNPGISSFHTLERFVSLLENLPGAYEVYLTSEEGEEGVLFCGNKIIRHAACKDLSGMSAMSEILSWSGVSFNIQHVQTSPEREIYIPLNYLLKVLKEKVGAGVF